MATIELRVNGREHTLDLPADMPLLTVLRELLGITGPKNGCGNGLCGACTCHVDGQQPVRACITPVSSVTGKDIVTIEGVADGATLHPVQQAWIDEDVAQCGFCQAGQIMRAISLLAENPQPSDEDIDGAMAGVLCRCGTYVRVRRAIHRAARSER